VFKAGSEQEKEFRLTTELPSFVADRSSLLAKDREHSVASLRLSLTAKTPIRFGITVQTGVENMNGN